MIEIYPLYEGSFSVDKTKKFIPFDSLIHKKSDRPASMFIYVQPFLIKTDEDLILIDTGLGVRSNNGELQIYNNIRAVGFEPETVTKVLFSHLHYDHAGGAMFESNGKWYPTFPQATYFIQEQELEHGNSAMLNTYFADMLRALKHSPNLRLLHGDEAIGNLQFEVTGGHCPFHQVIWVKSDNDTVFFGGDILPEPEQLQYQFIAKYDTDGRRAMELRKHYGKNAAENNWICLFYHSQNIVAGRIKTHQDSFIIEPYL